MALAVPTGSIVTVVVAGQDVLNPFGDALATRVSEALRAQGARLIVRSYTEDNRSITGPVTVSYRSTIVAETTTDRASADELAAVLSFAHSIATGYEPTEVGVAAIVRPGGAGAGEVTPLPDKPGGSPDVLGLDPRKLFEGVNRLLTAAPWIVLLIVLVIVGIVVAFSMRVTSVGPVRARA